MRIDLINFSFSLLYVLTFCLCSHHVQANLVWRANYLNDNIRIDVQADDESNSGVRFFRFKMDGSDSSSDDINLSIEGNEYDEAAIIQALAEQYGVPASSISLSVTGG